MATELHNFTGNEVIATELPSLLNQNFNYLESSRIKTVNSVVQDANNNIDVTSLVSQSIPTNSDLNNFTESGEYLRETDTIVVSNSPTEKPFFLTVLFAENLVKQVLTEIDSKDPMTFTRTLNGAKWSPWVEGGVDIGIWKSEETVNVGDVRFLKGRENAGYILECVTAGTTGETQPTFTEADVEDSAILMATEEEALAGEVDNKIMSPLQVANVIKNTVFGGGSVTPIAEGGTTATNASSARANLGLATAVTGASISGQTITVTFADGTTKTLATQDSLSNAMPSTNAITWGSTSSSSSATYTAPANGWIYAEFASNTSGKTHYATLATDNYTIRLLADYDYPEYCMMPIAKGRTVTRTAQSGYFVKTQFIYAESEV